MTRRPAAARRGVSMYPMGKGRLEAFSDGVLAILITIMVLELRAPATAELSALMDLLPQLLTYLLSFVYLGIYWNNHHHLLHAASGIDGAIMWANLHLLFWLSLIPFATGWLGQTGARAPTAIYGVVLLMAALAYFVLQHSITRREPKGSALVEAMGKDLKGKASLLLYAAGIALGCWRPWVAWMLYVGVAIMWLVPDRRMAAAMHGSGQ